jgi:hypothetical protein
MAQFLVTVRLDGSDPMAPPFDAPAPDRPAPPPLPRPDRRA